MRRGEWGEVGRAFGGAGWELGEGGVILSQYQEGKRARECTASMSANGEAAIKFRSLGAIGLEIGSGMGGEFSSQEEPAARRGRAAAATGERRGRGRGRGAGASASTAVAAADDPDPASSD